MSVLFLPASEEADLTVSEWLRQGETFLERRLRESAEDLGPEYAGLSPKAADKAPNPRSELYDAISEELSNDAACGREEDYA